MRSNKRQHIWNVPLRVAWQKKINQKNQICVSIIVRLNWPEMLTSKIVYFQEWNYSQNITAHIYQTLPFSGYILMMRYRCTCISRLIAAAFINARNQCKCDCILMNCVAANWWYVLMNLNLYLPRPRITEIGPLDVNVPLVTYMPLEFQRKSRTWTESTDKQTNN